MSGQLDHLLEDRLQVPSGQSGAEVPTAARGTGALRGDDQLESRDWHFEVYHSEPPGAEPHDGWCGRSRRGNHPMPYADPGSFAVRWTCDHQIPGIFPLFAAWNVLNSQSRYEGENVVGPRGCKRGSQQRKG